VREGKGVKKERPSITHRYGRQQKTQSASSRTMVELEDLKSKRGAFEQEGGKAKAGQQKGRFHSLQTKSMEEKNG